jgi:hypothetical protein
MHAKRPVAMALLVVGLFLAGCDRGTDSPPADPTPAEVPQTTTAGSTTAAAVIGNLREHGFKVGQVTESEAFGAKESVDVRIDGVEGES